MICYSFCTSLKIHNYDLDTIRCAGFGIWLLSLSTWVFRLGADSGALERFRQISSIFSFFVFFIFKSSTTFLKSQFKKPYFLKFGDLFSEAFAEVHLLLSFLSESFIFWYFTGLSKVSSESLISDGMPHLHVPKSQEQLYCWLVTDLFECSTWRCLANFEEWFHLARDKRFVLSKKLDFHSHKKTRLFLRRILYLSWTPTRLS